MRTCFTTPPCEVGSLFEVLIAFKSDAYQQIVRQSIITFRQNASFKQAQIILAEF